MKPVPKEIIAYEVANSWLAARCSWPWAQAIMGKYFGRKCYRKWTKYQKSMQVSEYIKNHVEQ